MISKQRIKEIYEEELNNPAQVIKTQDLQDLCILALQSIEQSKLAKIKKALEFYANKNNWDSSGIAWQNQTVRDYGSKAKEALKEIE